MQTDAEVFSIIVGTCLNTRVGMDPEPVAEALENPTVFVNLGDMAYNDGNDAINGGVMDSITYPVGTGLSLQIPAAVGGKIPTGSLTINSGGSGHPASLSNWIFWLVDPVTRAERAWGYLTTNGSGVVTAATLQYGGKSGDYSHTMTTNMVEGTQLFTLSHSETLLHRTREFVLATAPMQKFKKRRDSCQMLWYTRGDDHEHYNGGVPGSLAPKAPAGVTTPAAAWAFMQTTVRANLLHQAALFDNPTPRTPTTPYVPPLLSSLGLTGLEDAFRVHYFHIDLDSRGKLTTDLSKTITRGIMLDCLWESSDYQTGSDDASRYKISPIQEAWVLARMAEAHAAGVPLTVIFSGKDRYGQNSDGFTNYQTQWNRMNAAMQAAGYRYLWMTGDRHVPHAAHLRTAYGDVADVHVVCATAFGSFSDRITMYPGCDWVDQSPDVPVLGSLTFDSEKRKIYVVVHAMGTAAPKYALVIDYGQKIASAKYVAAAKLSPQLRRPVKLAPLPVTASRTAKFSDDGAILELSASVTYTLSNAVPLPSGVTLIGPASGTATLAVTGGATTNGATSTISITANSTNLVMLRAGSSTAYVVKT